ncbi:MAG: transposase, partial [Gammaproteobacteria bacterium]
TNLPPGRYSVSEVAKAYRLRWQVELLFKEWKSYANLHAFDTHNPAIVEGLIWAAIGAAALKRFLAHSAQVVAGVETSTRKAAMCAVHILHDIMRALISGIDNPFIDTLHGGSIISPATPNAHTLSATGNAGACSSVWSQYSAFLNYITHEH